MVIWINGAFGIGKTSAAFELNRRLSDSFVFDPENIGFYLRKNEPKQLFLPDFQDEELWRRFNLEMLSHICAGFEGTVIVPMTIVNAAYYREIITALRERGVRVDHYTLTAPKEIIMRRLKSRLDGRDSWAAAQAERCISSLADPLFENKIDTSGMTIRQVVETLALRSGLELNPETNNPLKIKIDRLITQIRHIRFNI